MVIICPESKMYLLPYRKLKTESKVNDGCYKSEDDEIQYTTNT